MGIVARMARPQALRGSWGPEDDRWYSPGGAFYGGILPSAAGVAVDSDSAMRLTTVQNCIRVRAFTVGMLPCHLIEAANLKKATEHPLYRLLQDQPNRWMSSFEFWSMAEAHICLRGNFFIYKFGVSGERILGLIPLRAGKVERVEQRPDYSLLYHTRVGNELVPIEGERIMHLRGLTLDGIMGVNPIEYARETIGLGMASVQFLGRYFDKGMHPGAVVRHPGMLKNDNLRSALKESYAGLGKSHDLMLLEENMTIEFPTIKLVDAQFLDQMKFTEAQTAGLFRVPLMLIQSGDKAPTYASAEEFTRSFAVFGITPDIVNYEKAIKRDLLTAEEQRRYYPKFSLDAMLRANFLARMQGYQVAVNTEILNPNEVRELEERPPYEGGETFRTRTSTVTKKDDEAVKTINERRADIGLPPMEGGDAIYMPATQIAAIEKEE